jgi:hypothetical protein
MQRMPRVFVLWNFLMMEVMMTTSMTGQNAMEIRWNGEMVTRRIQKALSRVLFAVTKWKVPSVVFI